MDAAFFEIFDLGTFDLGTVESMELDMGDPAEFELEPNSLGFEEVNLAWGDVPPPDDPEQLKRVNDAKMVAGVLIATGLSGILIYSLLDR